MSELTTAQKRRLVRELEKASKMHQKQADVIKKSLNKVRKKLGLTDYFPYIYNIIIKREKYANLSASTYREEISSPPRRHKSDRG